MEITFFSVLSHSSVIIDTVSHIGILLNLCNQDAGSDGMDRTGLNEEDVSLLYRHCIKHLQKCIFLNSSGKFFLADLRLKTIVEKRVFLGIHHVPHLGFSVLALIFQGIPVIRMDLDGQILLCVDKFDQNRKITEPSAVGSKDFFSCRLYVLFQCLSGIRTVYNRRRTVRMTGQFPCLSQHVAVIFFPVLIRQPAASPEIVLTAWFQFINTHNLSPLSKNCFTTASAGFPYIS